jgi:structural maintenance of chromosome 3 (chondroitin sulfate proteoglycan 6)
VLYDKQGRVQRFTTQAQRDKWLNDDIKSLNAYEKAQSKRVEDLKKDLEGANKQLAEVMERSDEHVRNEEERRDNLRKMSEEVTELKKRVDDMQEQRK